MPVRTTLAVDLDDLLFPFMEHFVPFHNRRYGTALTIEDYFSFDFDQVWESTRAEAIERVRQFAVEYREVPLPMEGSVPAIGTLARHYELVIVTSRRDDQEHATAHWVESHFSGIFTGIEFCNTYVDHKARSKAQVCRDIGAVALIDDSLIHITEVASYGIRGLLFGDYPWNRQGAIPAGAVRVADWPSVVGELIPVSG